MLSGCDVFTLKSGEVGKVHWTRPEVGVDITQEEYDRRVQEFGRAYVTLFSNECMRRYNAGKIDEARDLWESSGIIATPPWERKAE